MARKNIGKINISKLADTVSEELKDCAYIWNGAIREAQNQTAEETADLLRRTAPKAPGGAYAQSWTWDFDSKRDKYTTIVHASAPHYRLTHLLEFGHKLVAWGNTTNKMTRAFEHIAPAEKFAEDAVVENIVKAVEHAD